MASTSFQVYGRMETTVVREWWAWGSHELSIADFEYKYGNKARNTGANTPYFAAYTPSLGDLDTCADTSADTCAEDLADIKARSSNRYNKVPIEMAAKTDADTNANNHANNNANSSAHGWLV